MLAKLSSLLRSKKGFVGALLFFYGAVRAILGLLQDATYAASNWGAIVNFLTSGLGNLAVIVVGILLLLWAMLTQQPETESVNVALSQPEGNQELEQLRKSFRRIQQERDRLRARLSDPTAARRLEDERLRRRCLEVAHELQNFMRIGRHVDSNELVARFQQRHEWKVNELRNRLDEQAWLTPQERDALTFHADDYSHKIDDMVITLKAIGMGH